ncbi:MAG: M23 family metallopeptidase [Elainellaceae cyanobacterium]
MTKHSSSKSYRPYRRACSVLASGLGCASLLGSATNVAIAKQVVTATAPSTSAAQSLALKDASPPVEMAIVLPPEYFPLEIPAAEAAASKSAGSEEVGASAADVDAVSTDFSAPQDWVAAAAETSADASDLAPLDIDTSAADTPSVSPPVNLAPAADASPAAPAEAAPEAAPDAAPDAVAGEVPVDQGAQYIDPTDYSVGATEPTVGPDVVLSERSTGCKTVIRAGEGVPASVCGTAAANGVTPGSAGAVTAPPQGVNAVRVGTVSIDGRGIHLRRSVRDYYSRTARPEALRGNGNSALMFPLSVPARISSPFGWRIHPIFGNHRLHTGTDMAAPQGTPIVAAYSGRVALSDILGGYGVTVVLQHDERSAQTLYGHMSEVFVKSGEWVEQGTVIGRVGSTGNSTGPHLHFEYRQRTADGWVAVNAGELLQQSLAYLQDGFQLATVQLNTGLEIPELSIPKLLRAGKNAMKDAASDGAIASNIAGPEFIAVPGIAEEAPVIAEFKSRSTAQPEIVSELEPVER